jgi:2-polyprenyl-6-methoxyphenol hydroxylase-like FAD-dependent oxidoreductase
MPKPELVQQVVVIGGSLSGLLAAAALSGDGRTVTIVERDIFPPDPLPRSGVPQGRQTHVFLYRGLTAAEELLPGLRRDLLGAGAVSVNAGRLLWLSVDGWLPIRDDGFELISSTRPLLEHVVRGRTLALAGVTALEGRRVTGLRPLGSRWEVELEDGSNLKAELVVDASGRSSRLPIWLEHLGIQTPGVKQVDAHVGYATRLYAGGPPALADCAGIMVAATPQTLMGALAMPAEGGQWLILAVGLGEHRPPRDSLGFEAFLAGLSDQAISDLVSQCEPVSDVAVHRQTSNVRHPYEEVRGWPNGLLAVGDALCAFDPVYGQGITVGAVQALILGRAARGRLTASATPRLQRKIASSVATPWSIATSADLSFSTTAGELSRVQTWLRAWTGEVNMLSVHGNRRAGTYLSRVYNLMGPPALLAHPALIVAAVRARIFGYGPGTLRPSVLEELSRSVTAARARVSVEDQD